MTKQMLKFETAYKSDKVSTTLITAEYSSAYSEKDFNAFSAISFPMASCFEYKAGKTNYFIDANNILFEKDETEFTVSKYSMFNKDITISIQFLKPDEELNDFLLKSKKQIMMQKRSVGIEILLRRFLSIALSKDDTFKEQVLIDIINSVVFDKFQGKIITRANPYNVKQVDQSKDFIHAYCHENLRIADIASSACLSTFHFSRLFRKITGYAPYDYLLLTRIENAKSLLDKGVSVTQTAFSSGFNSLDNFSYAFSKITGFTPSSYKKGKISKI